MSTVRYYRWDDAGAPSLTGQVGSLINVLRKCLVGVGGIAYGDKPAAGWTEEFIGAAANIAVFRNSQADGGCGCYARVNDNAPNAAGAREATVNVYASMTAYDTGTNGTPNLYFRKSYTLDAAARSWVIVADARTAWVYCYAIGEVSTSIPGSGHCLLGFGDFASKLPVESANRYFAIGRDIINSAIGGNYSFSSAVAGTAGFVAHPQGTAAPVNFYASHAGPVNVGAGGYLTPSTNDPIVGGYMYQPYPPLVNSTHGYLGRLRGLYAPLLGASELNGGQFVPGSTKLFTVKVNAVHANPGQVAVIALDVEGPW